MLGGTTDDGNLLRSTEISDPAVDEFRAGPDLVSGRYTLLSSAAVLLDGRVVVAGGGPGVEVVDVAGADWASFSTVGVARRRLVVLRWI